jgi:regulator of replication initiation timing
MGVFDNLKTIGNVLKEVGKIELYQQLLEASANLLELQNENAKLKTKLTQLEEKLKNKDDLIPINNAYWKKSDNDGPFCTRCWDKNTDLIRMVNNQDITYYCPECKNSYKGPVQAHSSISIPTVRA